VQPNPKLQLKGVIVITREEAPATGRGAGADQTLLLRCPDLLLSYHHLHPLLLFLNGRNNCAACERGTIEHRSGGALAFK
jgi:hypothetical protein